MQRLSLVHALACTLVASGCSMQRFADEFPLVHRIDVQQGNVIEQEAVDRLRPGMDKRQVRFALGTPLLVDVFHQERWDYVHLLRPGEGEVERRRLSVFFEEDELVRVAGDFRPNPKPPQELTPRENFLVVPVLPERKKSLLDRFFSYFGFLEEDEVP